MVAGEKRQTLVTFFFFAVVTGVGGGTLRDVLIGAPVFWMHENATLLICMAAATLVWCTPHRIWGGQALAWFDAVGDMLHVWRCLPDGRDFDCGVPAATPPDAAPVGMHWGF